MTDTQTHTFRFTLWTDDGEVHETVNWSVTAPMATAWKQAQRELIDHLDAVRPRKAHCATDWAGRIVWRRQETR